MNSTTRLQARKPAPPDDQRLAYAEFRVAVLEAAIENFVADKSGIATEYIVRATEIYKLRAIIGGGS